MAAKRELKFAFEQRKHFFEVVAVRWGPAAIGYKHVDKAIAAGGLGA